MPCLNKAEQLTVGSLFSGIGGIDLGLERAGMKVLWQVENNPWCRKILTKHWPEVPKYEDVQTLDPTTVEPVDCLAGGFPCQDVSAAGTRSGLQRGNRSGLWFEFVRLIHALRPQYVFVENVPGLLVQPGLGLVLGELADCGYDAEWQVLSARAFGAPHLRKRVWIIAYPKKPNGQAPKLARTLEESNGVASWNGPPRNCFVFNREMPTGSWKECQPQLCGIHDGVPQDVDRLRGLGNAVVPQVVEWIGRQIIQHHERLSYA